MFDWDGDTNEIYIYDEIGPAQWGLIDAAMVQAVLKQFEGERVTVRLNTPGGSVDDGVAIYNSLRRHKGGVDTVVDSLAASMGSYLMQAGEHRAIAANALVMIHDPWSIAVGNAETLRKQADVLEKYRGRLVPEYAERSGQSTEYMEAIMADERWYTGAEAVEAGFADEVIKLGKNVEPNVLSLRRFARQLPEALMNKLSCSRRHMARKRIAAVEVF